MRSLTAKNYTTYTNPTLGFSFSYPKNFKLAAFPQAEGETVVVGDPDTTYHLGFQIFANTFDEDPAALTPERIKKDLPDLVVNNPTHSSLEDGTSVLLFLSIDPAAGPTREAWFVRDDMLYQLTVWALNEEFLDAWIRELLSELKF